MLPMNLQQATSRDDLVSKITSQFESAEQKKEAKTAFLDLWCQLIAIAEGRDVLTSSMVSSLTMYAGFGVSTICCPNPWGQALSGMAGIAAGRYLYEQLYGTTGYFQNVLNDPVTQRVLQHLDEATNAQDLLDRIKRQKNETYINYLHKRTVDVAMVLGGGLGTFLPLKNQGTGMVVGKGLVLAADTVSRANFLPEDYSMHPPGLRQRRPHQG